MTIVPAARTTTPHAVEAVAPGAARLDGEPATRPVRTTVGEVGEYWLALFAALALGLRTSVYAGITVGVVLGVLLAPLWLGEYLRDRPRRVLLGLGAVTLVWGFVLTWLSNADHSYDQRQAIADSAVLLQLVVGVGVLMWARRVAGLARVGLFFGGGLVAQGVLTGEYATSNPWKTFFAVPVAIVVLSLVARSRSNALDLVALLALAAASGLLNSRSYAATFAIAALLKLWQMRPRSLSRRGSVGLTLALLAGLAGAVYWLGQSLLVAGYLGSDAQARTIQQIDTSGNLILGGRPELSATVALIRDHPMGHGVGVTASFHDVMVAKSAMAGINYDPNNGYVERFMFGTGVELHSIIGDLWTHWGIVGLALFVTIAVLVAGRLAGLVLDRHAPGIVAFLACWSLWNLLFSPLYSAVPTLILGLALLLGREATTGSPPAADESPQGQPETGRTAPQRRPQRLR